MALEEADYSRFPYREKFKTVGLILGSPEFGRQESIYEAEFFFSSLVKEFRYLVKVR